MGSSISKATLGRLPNYLEYVRECECHTVSATKIAAALGYGDVQVRKDLSSVCGSGKPKTGYDREELERSLCEALGVHSTTSAVIVGAGKLGMALMGYGGFKTYGLEISAAFDIDTAGKEGVYPISELKNYCRNYDIKIGILTVPESAANEVARLMTDSGITAIWNFAPCVLDVPDNVKVKNENLALSLAHLNKSINN